MTDRRRAEIVAAYQDGKSSRQIASELQVAKSTVLNILRSAGAEVRPRGRGSRR
ncbi:helix-turn-helix domain-containing protein [Nocardioides sp. LHD-245]|uniref:helix-turn-helix domain-containing protein n=1 Tax=Nocardioides sp. LHD-245 TaxID=3051387 RepID=UPI0037093B3D